MNVYTEQAQSKQFKRAPLYPWGYGSTWIAQHKQLNSSTLYSASCKLPADSFTLASSNYPEHFFLQSNRKPLEKSAGADGEKGNLKNRRSSGDFQFSAFMALTIQ